MDLFLSTGKGLISGTEHLHTGCRRIKGRQRRRYMYNLRSFITFCHQLAGKFQKSPFNGVMMVTYDIKPTTNWTDRTIKKWYQI